MPGCVLRVRGDFSPDEFLRERPLPGVTRCERGILLVVVGAHGREALSEQIEDALAFLERQQAAVSALVAWPGVETLWLDFGLWRHDGPYDSASFPPQLLTALGSANVRLTVSFCPGSEEM